MPQPTGGPCERTAVDVGVEVGLRALVPERMVEETGGLPEAVAVLGQADVVDAALAGALGVQRHVGRRELRRAERDAVGREMEVIVDEQGAQDADALSGRIVERALHDLGRYPLPEDLDLGARAGHGVRGGHVRERDAAPHATAVAARGDATAQLAVDAHRLGAQADRARIVEHEAGEALGRAAGGALGAQRLLADERRVLVEPHGEADARRLRRRLGREVAAPGAIALLEPHRLDRAVAAAAQAVRRAGRREQVVEPEAVLRRRVELPAELAHVGHARGEQRHVADGDLPRAHVRERLVREVGLRERLQDVARARAPEAVARARRGDVVDVDRRSGRCWRSQARLCEPNAVPVTYR